MKKNAIFVLLANYRDPECEKTINELFAKAERPENISIGICWQYSDDDGFRCYDPENSFSAQIKVKKTHYTQSNGVCWARKIAQEFYDQEEYALTIDTHMQFMQNWDTYFIEQLQQCPSSKPLLSYYPAGYELPDKKSNLPPVINAAHSRKNRYKSSCFQSKFNIRGNMFVFSPNKSNGKPIRCFFYAGCFTFGSSEYLKQVPNDPYLDWEEEELAMALKLWTHGWDLFAPQKHHIFHLYHTQKPADTPYFRKARSKKILERRALLSKKRFYHLIGARVTNDPEALIDMASYPLGRQRSLHDFEMATGVDLKDAATTERSSDCWFALAHPNHPLRNETKTLAAIFTHSYNSVRKKGGKNVSGNGSTIRATEKLRKNLGTLITSLEIDSILDLGCGDFLWFKEIIQSLDLKRYIGIDIVKDLITKNTSQYSSQNCLFEHGDITSCPLPASDVVLIRDVLPHLKVKNVTKTLTNIKNSNSTYFIASHYPRCDRNRDLPRDGAWHKINLQIPPYSLPQPIKIIGDIIEKDKYLALWRTEDIPDFTNKSMNIEWMDNELGIFVIKNHLSKDESEYLSSFKYYHFTNQKIISLENETTDPILQEILKRTSLFTPPGIRKSATIIEMGDESNASLSSYKRLQGNEICCVTLLFSTNNFVYITTDSIALPIRLTQGKSVVLRKCSWNIPLATSTKTSCSDTRLLIQFFSDNRKETQKIVPETVNVQLTPDTVIFNSVGDVILARDMHRFFPQTSARGILNSTYDILASGDINLCNLETVISNQGAMHPKGEKNPYYFRASTTLAPLLSDAHFNIVTTGNNHAMDFGEDGLQFQRNYLKSVNIAHCGSGNNLSEAKRPVYMNVKETIVCLISFTCVRPKTIGATQSSPGVFFIENPSEISTTLSPIIQEAKEKAHVIIVSPHWIENWEEKPDQNIREEARKILNLGCDAIIGHSSHLLHGVELFDNKPIIYDMGSFLLDRTEGHSNLKQSALFQLVIKNKRITDLLVFPVSLENGKVDLAQGKDFQNIIDRIKSLDKSIAYGAITGHNHLHIRLGKSSPQHWPPKKIMKRFSSVEPPQVKMALDLSSDLTLDAKPSWNTNFKPINIQNICQLVDTCIPESFRVGTGFAIKVALQGSFPLEDYEVVLRGVSQKFNNTFEEVHLLSNGICHSKITGNSKYVVDYHFIRMSVTTRPGEYHLYWSLRHRDTGTFLQTTQTFQDAVYIGSIIALPDHLPMKASGVDWNGNLPEKLSIKFNKEFINNPEFGTLTHAVNRLLGRPFDEYDFSAYAYEQKYLIHPNKQLIFLQVNSKNNYIRWGCCRKTLSHALLRNIEKICDNVHYKGILQNNINDIVFKMEIITDEQPVDMQQSSFSQIKNKGLKLKKGNKSYLLLPSEAYDKKLFSLQAQSEYLAKKHKLNDPSEYSPSLIESMGHFLYREKVFTLFERTPEILQEGYSA